MPRSRTTLAAPAGSVASELRPHFPLSRLGRTRLNPAPCLNCPRPTSPSPSKKSGIPGGSSTATSPPTPPRRSPPTRSSSRRRMSPAFSRSAMCSTTHSRTSSPATPARPATKSSGSPAPTTPASPRRPSSNANSARRKRKPATTSVATSSSSASGSGRTSTAASSSTSSKNSAAPAIGPASASRWTTPTRAKCRRFSLISTRRASSIAASAW